MRTHTCCCKKGRIRRRYHAHTDTNTYTNGDGLQHTATHCNTLQHVNVCCLQAERPMHPSLFHTHALSLSFLLSLRFLIFPTVAEFWQGGMSRYSLKKKWQDRKSKKKNRRCPKKAISKNSCSVHSEMCFSRRPVTPTRHGARVER